MLPGTVGWEVPKFLSSCISIPSTTLRFVLLQSKQLIPRILSAVRGPSECFHLILFEVRTIFTVRRLKKQPGTFSRDTKKLANSREDCRVPRGSSQLWKSVALKGARQGQQRRRNKSTVPSWESSHFFHVFPICIS